MRTVAIIPSGGKGKRFDESLPKQYHQIYGKEIIVYALEIFQKSDLIDNIIIASEPEYFSFINNLKEKYSLTKITNLVEGGKERQDSVYNALLSLNSDANDFILVHDAARPLISIDILANALNTAKVFDNVIVCLKTKDTLIKGNAFVSSYLERNEIYAVQTPQIFRYGVLLECFKKAYSDNFYGTDESMLVTRAGYKVKIVEGSFSNFKITVPEDLQIFKKLCTNC